MSRPIRRVGTRAAAEVSVSDFIFSLNEPLPEQPADPARVATELLVSRMLSDAALTIDDAGRNGAVVLITVSAPEWVPVILEAWTSVVREGERSQNGFFDNCLSSVRWLAWPAEKLERSYTMDQAAETFSRAVAAGRHCIGIAADLSGLPNDLVQGADLRLTMPTLTGADVSTIAVLLCDCTVTEAISDYDAALLTPRLLRLARRPGQDTGSYVRKLRDLLQRDTATTATEAKGSPRTAPTLERLHGMDEAVEWGMRVHRDLQAFNNGGLDWSDVDRGCLLSGPPGTGKTLFARALAATCGVPLVIGSYSQWYGSGSAHQGDLLKGMRKTFREAMDCAPSILFVDEVDSFPNRATITHHYADWETQVVNALLAEVDGVEGREGVILVAACNHPDKLDPALVRSGRLDRHIRVQLPGRRALASILREHLGDDLAGEDLDKAALAASGSSGADCERLVRGARRRAREAKRTMMVADLMNEIGGGDGRSATELWLAAVHEAGHAVAGCQIQPGMVQAVTLRASGSSGGGTVSAMSGAYLSSADIHGRLVFLLCGRAAEEIVIGAPSSGAGGSLGCDLAIATGIAATAAAAMGLDDTVGLVWSGFPEPSNLRQMLVDDPALTVRVRAILDAAYADALALIRQRQAAVIAVANALVTRRVLDGTETAAIVARHPVEVGL